MIRLRAVGTGWTGGPGLVTAYFDPGVAAIDAALITGVTGRFRAFFDAWKNLYPAAIGWTVSPLADVLNPATGALIGQQAAGAVPSIVVGTGAGSIGPAFASIVAQWKTGTYINGRRLSGRTYCGPLASAYTDSPQPEGGALAAVANGQNALLASAGGPLSVIWHRPKPGSPGFTSAILTIGQGSEYGILRSRR